MANELLRVRGRHARPRAEPRRARDRRRRPRRLQRHRGGPGGHAAPARSSRCRSATASSAASSTRSASRSTASARSRPTSRRALELQAPAWWQRQAVQRAAADRHQGHRRDDPDRPRPAPADHRRPPDRQDRGRDRHDHQPEGRTGSPATRSSRCAASTSRSARRARPSPRSAGLARGGRRAGVHHDRRRPGLRLGRLQVPRALHRLGHRPALDVPGQARPDRLRRPVQAGRGLPRRVAAAAPPAGPRGLPRRRLLPALAACSSAARSCPTSWAPAR